VFSPTLSIPAGVFSSFLSDFQLIFDSPPLSMGYAYVQEGAPPDAPPEMDEAAVRHNALHQEDNISSSGPPASPHGPSQEAQSMAQGRHEDVDLRNYAAGDDEFV